MNHGNMDNTEAVARHIGLCAGYGGIELGLKRVIRNLRTVALCEVEAFAIANLVAKMEAGLMDPAPIWPDLKTFPYESFHGRVDILTGGYPCQPFSSAGKRLGSDDPRHLWPHIARGIRLLRPKLCFFENVEGHISLGLPDVIEDLAGMGYRSAWGIFSAAEVGAPHQRKRIFILADRHDGGSWGSGCHTENGKGPIGQGAAAMADSECDGDTGSGYELGSVGQIGQGRKNSAADSDIGDAWPSRPGEQQYGWEPARVVGNAAIQGPQERSQESIDSSIQTTQCGSGGKGDRQTQSALGRDADGFAGGMDYAELCVSCDNRTDELRLLGNGVVPATAALAFRTLAQKLRNPPANFSRTNK